ncbi:hypothetical protein Q8F55_003922 [Vanrija albida]|uniref:RZ-type domain-containing protein n=1 Tax=Vanrija albida TaxID=181172 RepID=A0ABR3Q6C3_9TREE
MLDSNIDHVVKVLQSNIQECLDALTFSDRGRNTYRFGLDRQGLISIVSGVQVFKPVASLLVEYFNRFPSAPIVHPSSQIFVTFLSDSYSKWEAAINSGTFRDPLSNKDPYERRLILDRIHKEIQLVTATVSQGQPTKAHAPASRLTTLPLGLLARVARDYDGPGKSSPDGPRHDNDHESIAQIKVVPTAAELVAKREPYLPANSPGAKHHLPPESMDKLFDVQFRLLRADAFGGLEGGVKTIVQDMMDPDPTRDAPPGRLARSSNRDQRKRFWSQTKRMQHGALVALIAKHPNGEPTIAVATLAEAPDKFTHDMSADPPRFSFTLIFMDPQDALRAARAAQNGSANTDTFLVESPVLYAAVKPFLEMLSTTKFPQVPFSDYLLPQTLRAKQTEQPQYTQIPGFEWDLSCLLKKPSEVVNLEASSDEESCTFDPRSPLSTQAARDYMHEHSKLDLSQSDALIDSLTREVALIQGPPGTGKTFTGVELLRVLFANKVGPVLLLAYTNHALDHILRAVYDSGVTDSIVRLGSMSKDEVVSQFNMDYIGRSGGDSSMRRDIWQSSEKMKEIEKKMKANEQWTRVSKGKIGKATRHPLWEFWKEGRDLDFLRALGSTPQVASGVQVAKPKKSTEVVKPPENRFHTLESVLQDDESDEDDTDAEIDSQYAWVLGGDWSGPQPDSGDEDNEDDSDDSVDGHTEAPPPPASGELSVNDVLDERAAFLQHYNLNVLPRISHTARPVQDLLADLDVWNFSAVERQALADFIERDARAHINNDVIANLEMLSNQHQLSAKRRDEARDNIKVFQLHKISLVGATTSGPAKLSSLMRGFEPKVLVLEEAGQILESHVLSTLFPSVQHMIAIGDPLQLRPQCNRYEFSMDNARGRDLYRLDLSLMERLSSSGLPMSQLLVQRRMAPPISSLIRKTLYPSLQDHELVHAYPAVSGMGKSLFFLDHDQKEHGGDDGGSSKRNYFEMACDLALYLLKQGPYSEEGDIVILCGYLGQLMEVRELLRNKVVVVIGEKDKDQLAKLGDDDNDLDTGLTASEVAAGKHILLRTVDNFQGEEAKIVILSLVRNAGASDVLDANLKRTIGFLRSPNRTNVAISRAKHGMYILGNAEQLSSGSSMWNTIIDELASQDVIGPGFPIACTIHGVSQIMDKPGVLSLVSPNGGCLQVCNQRLVKCGHFCKQILDQISDMIMQATLADVIKDEPDALLVTLECGHVFTLETLDGAVGLTDYYDTDGMRWTGLKTPSGFQNRPTCPSCRGPITSPRYNRLKGQVDRLTARLDRLGHAAAEELVARDLSEIAVPTLDKPNLSAFNALSVKGKKYKNKAARPKGNAFGLTGALADAWRTAANPYLDIYRTLSNLINSKRMPHRDAYESAVATVFRAEHALGLQSAVAAHRDPSSAALTTARRRLGAPPPAAQTRFQIESIHLSIKVRLEMVKIANKASEALADRANKALLERAMETDKGKAKAKGQAERARRAGLAFTMLGTGLLASATRDAQLALNLASARQLARLEMSSLVVYLDTHRHKRSYEVEWRLRQAPSAQRAQAATALRQESKAEMDKLAADIDAALAEAPPQLAEYAQTKIRPAVNALLEEWKNMTAGIGQDGFYQAVSAEGKLSIIKAMMEENWGYGGRYYQCPNGHPYVIGDCGQPMATSRCLECGAEVGGHDHTLLGGNARDAVMEAVAREAGAMRNPHAF